MENRTAFWQQIPKLQERTASKSERRHRGACGLPAFAVKLVGSGHSIGRRRLLPEDMIGDHAKPHEKA